MERLVLVLLLVKERHLLGVSTMMGPTALESHDMRSKGRCQ